MDIIGKWKIREFHIPTPDGVDIFTPDTLPDDEQYADYAQMSMALTEFTPDGKMDTLMPVPEEMLEQVKNEGFEIRDGFAVIKSTAWKEQDGKFFFDSHIEGEILGETVDPFMEIKVLPDGCLLYNMDVLVLERVKD